MVKAAQEYLQKQYDAAVEFNKTVYEQAIKAGEQARLEVPKYFDFSDIVTKAKELYGFVATK